MDNIVNILKDGIKQNNHFTFLIGAGLSAESGIPTFRGEDGYWVIGSKNYHPQEMATRALFMKHPLEVWEWYLHRIKTCYSSKPNTGHYALVKFEALLKDKFSLVSQNVDGLNLRAGSSIKSFFPIHGDLTFMRCFNECSNDLYKIEDYIDITESQKTNTSKLICPKCNSITRPHVLWFDESYDETFYKLDSVIEITHKTDILITIGTTGTTNLPYHIFKAVMQQNGTIIDINLSETVFSDLLNNYPKGYTLKGKSGEVLPQLLNLATS